MEKVFTYMKCYDGENVAYAIYILKGRAYGWWQMQERILGDGADQKEKEFRELKKNDKTVAEYEEEFTYLSKFAPQFVATEEDRACHFEEGLQPNIKFQMSSFELSTYVAVLKKALVIERNEKKFSRLMIARMMI
ncbi:uncharacterized protein LOC109834689 [Asparagus officinalis]|uniref:uncharacterized protein LOC109834689 n=1 Tax=Asparagus officinalis TaxID=4686 RepID=UPI00098E579E|nr:uncharacterized protein LOC109834689 [Asparagus officinalis]